MLPFVRIGPLLLQLPGLALLAGVWIGTSIVEKQAARIRLPAAAVRFAAIPPKERVHLLGLPPDRADVLAPAVLAILAVARHFHVRSLIIPGTGLRETILRELVEQSEAVRSNRKLMRRLASVSGACAPNAHGLLKAGMFLTTRLSRGAVDALLIPEEALVPEGGEMFVFVVQDGTVEKRRVRIGERRVGDVQVLEGLASGESVVTEGTQKLRDGAAITLQSASPAPVAAEPRAP